MNKKTKKMLEVEARFGKPIEELLSNLYENQCLSIREVGINLGILANSIGRWLHKCDIPTRTRGEARKLYLKSKKTPKMLEVEAKFGKPIEELLSSLYIEQQLSMPMIACELEVFSGSIGYWLQKCDIPTRTISQARKLRALKSNKTPKMLEIENQFGKPIEELLSNLYIDEQLSLADIAEKFSITLESIRKWLKFYNIPIRTRSEAQKTRRSKSREARISEIEIRFGMPMKELLKHLYIEKHMSIAEISREFNVSPRVAYKWLLSYDISTRAIGEAVRLYHDLHPSEIRAEIENQFGEPLKGMLYDLYVTEQLSSGEIARKFDVPRCTVYGWLRQLNIPTRTRNENNKLQASKSPKTKTAKMVQIEKETGENLHDLLIRLYQKEQHAPGYIAQFLGVSVSFVRKCFRYFQIPTRTKSEAKKLNWQNPEYQQKKSDNAKDLWKNPEYRQHFGKSPNKPEALISRLTPMNVRYTGDGKFYRTLPNSKGTNPDFIVNPIKETRKVIYHHGIYWHRHELHNRGQDLIDQWEQLGFECLIIWEDELDSIEAVVQKIAAFIKQETWQLQLF